MFNIRSGYIICNKTVNTDGLICETKDTLLTSLALVVHSAIADPLTEHRAKLAEQRQQLLDARKQADTDARRGWHWYNDEDPQPEELPDNEKAQTPPPEPEKPVEQKPEPPKTVN